MRFAILFLLGCEKAYQEPPPPPPPPPAPHDAGADAEPHDSHFTIVYAARTDDASDGANPTFFNIVEDSEFFVIADATRPEVSKAAAELMGELFAKECHDVVDDEAQMRCALDHTTAKLVLDHRRTSIAAVIVRGDRALIARAGDTPVGWRHRGSFDVFDTVTPQLGAGTPARLQWIDLSRGDTVFVVNKRLLDVAGKDAVRGAAPEHEMRKDALGARVDDLLATGKRLRGRSDAVTALAIHLIRPAEATDAR